MEATDPFAGLFQSSEEDSKTQQKQPASETPTPIWQKQPSSSVLGSPSTAQPLSSSKSLNNSTDSTSGSPFVPIGDSKAKKAKETEASVRSVESVLERFTQHIQGVVDSINRYILYIGRRCFSLGSSACVSKGCRLGGHSTVVMCPGGWRT